MTSPMERPSKSDRRAAAFTVEQACANGTIVAADRDLRLQQVESAQTVGELDVLVRNLTPPRAQQPVPPPAPAASPVTVAEPVNPEERGYPDQPFHIGVPTIRVRPKASRFLPAVIALIVLSGVGSTLVSFAKNVTGGATTTASPGQPVVEQSRAPVEALSVAAIKDLIGDVRTRTGATQVYEATIFAHYAVLQLPAASEQQTFYRWDGELGDPSLSTNARGQKQIDLSTIDPAVVVRLSERARKRLVDDPTTWYVIIRPPLLDDQAVIYAYASNAASQGGYISAKADGTVVRRVTW